MNPKIILTIFSIIISQTVWAQLADASCKYLGNIISSSTPSDFAQYWNQVTPENAGKWGSVESTRDVMSWGELDNAYNTAKNNNFPFKQHTLVWGQQQPTWLSELSAEEQKAEVEEWISAYCTRYPETDYIDVVNEPLHAMPSYRSALGGSGSTGWDWVIWSFEKARQYCPNAKLILNDYNIINNNSATSAYVEIINILKTRDLIDGVGEQGHFLETTPLETIETNLDALAETQIPIHISEFDIHLASDAEQKARYEALFPLLWEHSGVHGITLWGYKQGQMWRTEAYLQKSNGTDRTSFTWLKDYMANSDGGALCVGVGVEQELPRVEISPNPLRDNKLTLHLDRRGYGLKVFDSMGRMVTEQSQLPEDKTEVMLSTPGVYLVVISDGNRRKVEKVIKY